MVGLILGALVAMAWCLFVIKVTGTRFAGPSDKPLRAHRNRRLPPPLGGVGVFLGTHFGLYVEGLADPGIFAASTILLGLGLADDFFDISALLRLGVEAGAGAVFYQLANIDRGRGVIGLVVAVLLVVVVVNAVNLLDGLDGLAGLSALISALGIAALADLRGESPWVGLVVAGVLGGFLLFNWYPARIFLGDNGAYVTGLFLVYAIFRASPTVSGSEIAIGVAILGVFLVDLVATVVRRALSRRPLFVGDRSHVYDRLRARDWSIPRVVVAAAAVQGLFALLAVALDSAGVGWWALGALGLAIALLLVVFREVGLLQTDAT